VKFKVIHGQENGVIISHTASYYTVSKNPDLCDFLA